MKPEKYIKEPSIVINEAHGKANEGLAVIKETKNPFGLPLVQAFVYTNEYGHGPVWVVFERQGVGDGERWALGRFVSLAYAEERYGVTR